jgi:DNA-binding NarL/FixJ family response regulator
MALMRGGFEVVGEASSRDEAIEAVLQRRPQVCLLDVYMPGGGIEAAAELAKLAPATALVMLTVSARTEDVLAALRAGAVGYLPKDTHPDRLPAALRGVLKGEAAIPRAMVGRVLDEFRDLTAIASLPVHMGGVKLTGREAEIFRLLRSGHSTIQISDALSLSPITVRRHISSGMAKLGVADRHAALDALEPAFGAQPPAAA